MNKHYLLIILFFLPWILSSCSADQTDMSVMSFNIRFANPADEENYWEYRKENVADLIEESGCDFIGLQEALPDQIRFLADEVSSYSFIWRTREIDPEQGEAVPILYKDQKWDLMSSETLWLSDTPEVPGSNTWNAACNRVMTYARFSNRETGKEVLILNTHFDHISQEARMNSSRLILNKSKQLISGDIPVILLGDLNGRPDNPAIKILTDSWYDPYTDFHPGDTVSGTFHGFKGESRGGRIDYVLFHGPVRVKKIEIIRTHTDGLYPSDHFPVFASLEI